MEEECVEAGGGRSEQSMKVFVPMDERGQPLRDGATTAAPSLIDRRRYPRHRYHSHVEIHREQGLDVDAMTFELSEGGMSAATPNLLTVGEKVEISTIAGTKLKAVVRRKNGAMYGFEFVGLTEEVRERIRNTCKGLPMFLSMLEDV